MKRLTKEQRKRVENLVTSFVLEAKEDPNFVKVLIVNTASFESIQAAMTAITSDWITWAMVASSSKSKALAALIRLGSVLADRIEKSLAKVAAEQNGKDN